MSREDIGAVLWLLLAMLIVGWALGTGVARADERMEAATYAVCQQLGAHPSTATVQQIIEAMSQRGFTPAEISRTLTYGVQVVCPEQLALVVAASKALAA